MIRLCEMLYIFKVSHLKSTVIWTTNTIAKLSWQVGCFDFYSHPSYTRGGKKKRVYKSLLPYIHNNGLFLVLCTKLSSILNFKRCIHWLHFQSHTFYVCWTRSYQSTTLIIRVCIYYVPSHTFPIVFEQLSESFKKPKFENPTLSFVLSSHSTQLASTNHTCLHVRKNHLCTNILVVCTLFYLYAYMLNVLHWLRSFC